MMKGKFLKSLLCVLFVTSCTTNQERYQEELLQISDSIQREVESLQWCEIGSYKGQGSTTISDLKSVNPIRIKYVYNDMSNTGFTIYHQTGGQPNKNPLIISTESEHNCVYFYPKAERGVLKIVTGGRWAMVVEELGCGYVSSVSPNLVDSLAVVHVKDSLMEKRMNLDAQNDTIKMYPKLEESTKEWRLFDSRRGVGEFETEWFSLPKCKLKIVAEATAFGNSFRGGISLEGKTRKETWDIIPGAWYMSSSPIREEKIIEVPAGKYFFYVGVDNATWEYRIYTYY